MLEALEVMIGINPSMSYFDKIYATGWDVSTKNDASKYINILTDFTFIVSIIAFYRFFHPIAPITQKLQGRSINMVSAYGNISSCSDDLKLIRKSINEEFSTIHQQSDRMTEKLGAVPAIPRTAA